jgi:hypothetical protein
MAAEWGGRSAAVGGRVTATGLTGADGTVVVVTGAVTAEDSDSRDGHRGGTEEPRDSREGQREPAVSLRTQTTTTTDLKNNLCITEWHETWKISVSGKFSSKTHTHTHTHICVSDRRLSAKLVPTVTGVCVAPSICKSWHSLRRQAEVSRSV